MTSNLLPHPHSPTSVSAYDVCVCACMCVCMRVASHSSKSHSLNYTRHDSQFCHVEGCSSNKINKTTTGFNLLKTKIKVLQITFFFFFYQSQFSLQHSAIYTGATWTVLVKDETLDGRDWLLQCGKDFPQSSKNNHNFWSQNMNYLKLSMEPSIPGRGVQVQSGDKWKRLCEV